MKLSDILNEDFNIKDASSRVRGLIKRIIKSGDVDRGVEMWDKAGFSQSHIQQKGEGGKQKKPSFLNGKKKSKKK